MAKARRDGEGSDREDGEPAPTARLTPGKRSGTAGAPDLPPPKWPGKRTLTQHFAPRRTRTPLPAGAAGAAGGDLDDIATTAIERKDAGSPVDAGVRARVEPHVGADLGAARIHGDREARAAAHAIGARAFAHGPDIFLGPGESEQDVGLLAHELTHVAQQAASGPRTDRKVTVGDAHSPAEAEADAVAARVTSGAPQAVLIVDAGPAANGQLARTEFLDHLEPLVVAVASQELGTLSAAAGCPYIVAAFAKYRPLPGHATEQLIKRWIPAARDERTAEGLIPLVLARVRAGVRSWRDTGRLSDDLAAAEPALAASVQGAAEAAPKSIDGLEAELGPGAAPDPRIAAQVSRAVGRDVSSARVHTGSVAARRVEQHDAAALAVGPNVMLGAAAPAAGTLDGDALLAHELAHTAQQHDAASDPVARRRPIGGEDAAAELDADHAAGAALAGNDTFGARLASVTTSGLQLQRCPEAPAPTVTAPDPMPRTPAPPVIEASARTPEAALFAEGLPVQLGKRTYQISGHARDAGAFLQVELLGTREAFEVPLTGAVPAGARFRVEARAIEAASSTLEVALEAGKHARPYRVEIEPSPYEADPDRPDRVRVIDGDRVFEKEVFPAGSKYRLSPSSADLATAIVLPGSGKAKGTTASLGVELAARPGVPGVPGVALTLALQKTGEKHTVTVDAPDLTSGFARLARHAEGKPDARGNPTRELAFDTHDAAGARTGSVELRATSWLDAGAKDEGYTWAVAAGGQRQTGGFTVPSASTHFDDFAVRRITDQPDVVETVVGDGYQVQLVTAGARGLSLMFHRASPRASTILLRLVSQATGAQHELALPYRRDRFRPRIVAEDTADRGHLFVGFDGDDHDLLVSWDAHDHDGDVPKLDESNGPGHVVLARAHTTVVHLLAAGAGLPAWQATWRTPLSDDFIAPPRWVQTQIGPRVGWLHTSTHRFVPLDQLGPQVAGAAITKILGQELAIGYVHGIPVVGELVMVGEAIVGKEIVTGRDLSTQERVMYLAIGAVAAALGGAARIAAARQSAQAIAREAEALAKATGMAEADATALLRATAKLSEEERAFLARLRAETQAGKALGKQDIAHAGRIFKNLEADLASIKASLRRAKAAAPVASAGPLAKNEIVIDANTAIALNKRSLGLPLQPGERALLDRLDQLGATEYRVANVTAGEVKTGDVAWQGLDLTVKRSSKEYKRVLTVLDRWNVGKRKGIADRAIVADAFFSQTEPGVTPRFATQDKGVYNNLLAYTGVDPQKLGQQTFEAFPGGFDVSINGRKLTVIPMPNPRKGGA